MRTQDDLESFCKGQASFYHVPRSIFLVSRLTQVLLKVLNLKVRSKPIPSAVRAHRPPLARRSGVNAASRALAFEPAENFTMIPAAALPLRKGRLVSAVIVEPTGYLTV